MNVYVAIHHDVWDLGRDPGHENENGEPEETTVDAVFASRKLAETHVQTQYDKFPDLDPQRNFFTIEEHLLKCETIPINTRTITRTKS